MDRADLEDDLAAYLDGEEEAPDGPEDPPADVGDPSAADALLRRLGRLGDQEAEILALAAEERARIDGWARDRTSGIERRRAWLVRSLEGWFRRYAAERRIRSVKLPHGNLGLRADGGRVVVEDPDAFREWCEANDEDAFVRVTVEPDKAALRRLTAGEPSSTPTAAGELAHPLLVERQPEGQPEPTLQPVPGVALVKSTEPAFTWKA